MTIRLSNMIISGGTDTIIRDPLYHVREEQADTVDGGSSSSGVNVRVLNTEVTAQITGASLSSNQITLPAGTYYMESSAPCRAGDNQKLIWRNTTDAANELSGNNTLSRSTADTSERATLEGEFTITATKTFELRHYITTAFASFGLGSNDAVTQGVEVYSEVRIWRRDAQTAEVVIGTLSVEDQKAAGVDNTDMGSSSTWNTRTLNTEVRNTIAGATLVSDVITLPAGTYRARAIAPAYRIAFHKCRLRDTTNSVTLAVGTPERNHNGSSDGFITGHSLIDGSWFTLSAEADIELQHFCTVANGTNGGGLDAVGDAEIARFASVVIEKMST